MRTTWTIRHEEDGWMAVAYDDLGEPTGEKLGPFETRPDLEAALLKRGVSFTDINQQ